MCFQRCVGMDAFNAVLIQPMKLIRLKELIIINVFIEYMKYVQENDLAVDGCMTDARGDRSKSPGQQPDPDAYLHVVERREDGVVVRGCKLHQTGMINSHEILVMPNNALKEDEKEWAISFAIPLDTPGMIYVYGRQSCDTRKLEGGNVDVGNIHFGGQE